MTDSPSPIRESGETARLYEALARAQAEFLPIEKKRVGVVEGETKLGKAYKYRYLYADLSDVHTAVRPALTKYGLTTTQLPQIAGGSMILITRLAHGATGAWIECDYPVSSLEKLAHQRLGAALTYARRYALSSILGVAAEDDIDSGEGEQSGVDDRAEWHGQPAPAPQGGPPRQAPPKAAEPPRRAPAAAQATAQADPAPGIRPTPSTGGEAANSAGATTRTTSEVTTQTGTADPIVADMLAQDSYDGLKRWWQANKDAIGGKPEAWKNEFFPRYDHHMTTLREKAGVK